MGIRTRMNPLGGGARVVTLTVSTNPASATCVLRYNNIDYTTKSLEVKSGSTITYTINHATYGTTTGSIVMDSDKTLTCNGTYSTSQVDGETFNQPTLSSDGTLGGNNFAVYADSHYSTSSSYVTWHAFDKNGKTNWLSKVVNPDNPSSYPPVNLVLYYPVAVRVVSCEITNRYDYNNAYTAGRVYGSNSNSNWTKLKSFTNSIYDKDKHWTILVNSSNWYKYYKITFTDMHVYSGGTAGANQIDIVAYESRTAYSYYWDKFIS